MFSLAKLRFFLAPLLVAWMAFLPVQDAMAGYAALTPPTGWASTAAGATWTRPAANAALWVNGKTASSAIINVAGRSVSLPVNFALAANAAEYVVAAARLTPAAFAAGAVATWLVPFGIYWVVDHWAKMDSVYPTSGCWWQNGSSPAVMASACAVSDAIAYWMAGNPTANVQADTGTWTYVGQDDQYVTFHAPVYCRGCAHTAANQDSWVGRDLRKWSCPGGQTWSLTAFACVGAPASTSHPVTDPEWAVPAASPSIPDEVANAIPGPLPIGLPIINPDPAGLPQPLTVPTGAPVPVPGTVPQQYEQPVVDIVPFPTPASPWQVDLRPRVVTSPDPAGVPDAGATPTPTPDAAASAPPFEFPCGVGEKLPCKVKVDETGTPSEAVDPVPKIEPALQPAKDVATAPDSVFPAFPDLNWTFALPSGCSVIPLAAFAPFVESIDVCQFQPMFHDLMTVVWLVGGIFGAIQLFLRDALAS